MLYWQGLAYESRENVTPDMMVMASKYYRQSAELGYSLAQCSLGYMYEMGFTDDANYKSDTISAKHWFNLSFLTPEDEQITDFSRGKKMKNSLIQIKNGDKDAELFLGWLYLEAGVMYWDFCTKFNNSVISDYYTGKGQYGINNNKKRREYAVPLVKRGADYGVAQAQYIYGRTLYLYAIDFHRETHPDWSKYPKNVEDDQKIGVEYLKMAAKQNHAEAAELLCKLGNEYPNEYLSEYELMHYTQIAADGEEQQPRALYHMGKYYENGNEWITADYNKAIAYYEQAASMGHYKAASRLAHIYFLGKGFVRHDWSKAYHWRKIARGNDEPMAWWLRILYLIMWIFFLGLIISVIPIIYRIYIVIFAYLSDLLKKIVTIHLHKELIGILGLILIITCAILTAVTIIYPLGKFFTPDVLHEVNPLRGLF